MIEAKYFNFPELLILDCVLHLVEYMSIENVVIDKF